VMSATESEIREALDSIPADDRDVWVQMGMAVKSALPGKGGFRLWDKWSQGADNYDSKAAQAVWKSIDENGPTKIGSLFHEAKKHGWKPKPTKKPRKPKAEPEKPPGITLAEYAALKNLQVDFLKSLGLRDHLYLGGPSVRMPYLG